MSVRILHIYLNMCYKGVQEPICLSLSNLDATICCSGSGGAVQTPQPPPGADRAADVSSGVKGPAAPLLLGR